MKKLQFLTASAAFAALMLTACTDKMDFSQESVKDAAGIVEDNSIQFNTYLSGNAMTRAGWAGNIDNNKLKDLADDGTTVSATTNGFGVFAYYTQTAKYESYWTGVDISDFTKAKQKTQAANFMFNQQVKWNNGLSDAYITKWEYSPLKYWPNEVQAASYKYKWDDVSTTISDAEKAGVTVIVDEAPTEATVGTLNDIIKISSGETYFKLTNIEVVGNSGVDDQDNDADNNNAYTDYTKGGNLTFFAYAPYVTFTQLGASGNTSGITAINKKTVLADANKEKTDPIITYVLPSDGKDVVDLLWGTRGNTSVNVNGADNAGVKYSELSTDPEYHRAILPHKNGTVFDGYTMNADLTKQKTNGVIDFAFKHALAKVGGSITNTSTTTPSDVKNGLMIILDLDDQKGAESGGSKADVTKVTVKEIKIVARSLVENEGKKPGESTYTAKYLKTAEGDFNLATGQWDITGTKTTTLSEAQTTTYIIDQDGTGTNVAGELNKDIKEPASFTAWSSYGTMAGVVETTAKNVYETEAAPLVYIPSTYPELTVTVDYIVRTQDANLEKGYSEVEQKITKRLTFENAVELNKQYSILIHLGLTSVKFTATVSDWEVNDQPDKNFDSDGDNTLDIHVEDVYVPINVATAAGAVSSAMAYEYTPAYTPKGTSTIDGSKITYTIPAATLSGEPMAVINDLARFLGALWRTDDGTTVSSIKYGSTIYTWKPDEHGAYLEGSNWRDSSTPAVTLVKQISTDFSSITPPGPYTLTLYINGIEDADHKIEFTGTVTP